MMKSRDGGNGGWAHGLQAPESAPFTKHACQPDAHAQPFRQQRGSRFSQWKSVSGRER
jgi:hypothetical protein